MYGILTRFYDSGKIRCSKVITNAKPILDKDGKVIRQRDLKSHTERMFFYNSTEKAQRHIDDCKAFSTC